MRLFHVHPSTSRIRNWHQTMTDTTTSQRSHGMAVLLSPRETLLTDMRTVPVTVKSTSEIRVVNLCLLCLDEMRRICFHERLLPLD
jgi:hypothetical protein